MRNPIATGDIVRIKESRIFTYKQVYAVDARDTFTVAHVERRSGRKCLYLKRPGWEVWMPVWGTHVAKVRTKT